MKRWLLALMIVTSCKQRSHVASDLEPPPELAIGRCDEISPARHTCTEIYDPTRLAVHETACVHGRFTRGTGCSHDATTRGCLLADGSVAWIYAGDLACHVGFTGKVIFHEPSQTYECPKSDGSCIEEHSVYDTGPEHHGGSCTGFFLASCPSVHAVGRCALPDVNMESYRVFYLPLTSAEARAICEDTYRGTFAPM